MEEYKDNKMNSITKKHIKLLLFYFAIPFLGVGLGKMVQLISGRFSTLPLQILAAVNPTLCAIHRIVILKKDNVGKCENKVGIRARTVFSLMIPVEIIFSIICLVLFLS